MEMILREVIFANKSILFLTLPCDIEFELEGMGVTPTWREYC
jgi:hypothetical protein